MVPGLFGVDIFGEIERIIASPYRLIILEGSVVELRRIQEEAPAGKDGKAATIALKLLEVQHIENKHSIGHVDDAIVAYAKNNTGTIVATSDRALKDRLAHEGIGCIVLRSKSHLGLISAKEA